METQKHEMRIMRDLRPAYYDEFHCLAEKCRISCCKGWRISFDKKDYLSLKRQTGSQEFNQRMEHSLHRIRGKDVLSSPNAYAEIMLQDGICPLLCKSGLCYLQIEKGYQALPRICQTFPRSKNYQLSGYLERSLGLSCEGVLALLWNHPEGIDFVSDPLGKDEKHALVTFSDSQNMLIHFQDIRAWCIDILQNRSYSLPERILRMGIALKELADGEKDISRWLIRAQALAQVENSLFMDEAEKKRVLSMFLSNNTKLLRTLQSQNQDFIELKKDILAAFNTHFVSEAFSKKHIISPWELAKICYEEKFGDKEYFMENIMVALFFHFLYASIRERQDDMEKLC